MRSNLTFLASDLLEGRGTPSRGLDIAAEYIAAQFGAAGLEPAGDRGYFQTADWDELAKTLPVRPGRPALELKPAGVPHDMANNVVGILRGSDPVLKDTYILVTAHYDHLGINTSGQGDRYFNGANDDGSGTVSVIELAKAFSAMKVRPKRSIVFMTFFGALKVLAVIEAGTPTYVPVLWWLETANGLLMSERRRRSTQAGVARALQAYQDLPVITDDRPVPLAAGDLLALARQYQLTVYDAAYLELALRRGSSLATADLKLAKAADAAGVSVLGASE